MHSLSCKPCLELKRFTGDWCHAGGVINFAKVGIVNEHENYGFPHVLDHVYDEKTTNCIFCGKEVNV